MKSKSVDKKISQRQLKNGSNLPLYSCIVLVVICLVSLTSTFAMATNESSFRFGFHLAENNLTNQIVPPWDVDEDSPSPNWNVKWPSHGFMNPDICNLDSADNGCPSTGDVQAVYCTTGQSDHVAVTNSTACLDGYVNGWRHWCTEDNYNNSKYCSDLVFGGNSKDGSDFPGALFDEVMSNQSAHFKSIKNYVDSWRYFCTKDGYKNAKTCDKLVFAQNKFPGTFMNENKTLLSIMPLQSLLSGNTWNFINESNGHGLHPYPENTTTIVNKAINKWRSIDLGSDRGPILVLSNLTKFSGKVTFDWYQVHITTTKGIDVDYSSNPGWWLEGNHTLILDGITPVIEESVGSYFLSQPLTFLKISTHLIELQDKHGDTIYLTRGGKI